jgi:fucose 4-O-acetylase-like acetyltransferase
MLMAADSSWNMALMSNLNAPTWFLTCLFLCWCIYFVIDRKFSEPKQRRMAVAAATGAGILLRTISPVLLPWSLENALYFTALLELGRFLKEEGLAWLRKNQWIYGNFFLVFLVLSYWNGSVNVSISEYGRSMAVYLVIGALGSLLCMKAAELTEKYCEFLVKPLGFIGQHTMPILCWHLFVIEMIKAVLPMLGM